MLILVDVHDYGPTNLLYFCDVALLVTLAAVWLDCPILAPAPAVGILFPQFLWVIDFSLAASGLPRQRNHCLRVQPDDPDLHPGAVVLPRLAALRERLRDMASGL